MKEMKLKLPVVLLVVAQVVFAWLLVAGVIKTFAFNETGESKPAGFDSDILVHFIDVGQGDAILIQDSGKNMLIDTGSYAEKDKLEKAFADLGVDAIDVMVLTHPDADHIGCAPYALSYYGVEQVYMSTYEKDSKNYSYLLEALEEFKTQVFYPEIGDEIIFGSAIYKFLGPQDCAYEDVNSYSLILKMVNGNDSFLFLGDATGEEIDDALIADIDLSADVVKLAHHGSANCGCNSEKLLSLVNPRYAIVSCGKDNEYGHPHKETMELLNKIRCTVYRTDEQGTISCVSTGNGVVFNFFHN